MPRIEETPERKLRRDLADVLREKGLWKSHILPDTEQILNILRTRMINRYDLHNGELQPYTCTGDDIPF